jgi:hypothetical protein
VIARTRAVGGTATAIADDVAAELRALRAIGGFSSPVSSLIGDLVFERLLEIAGLIEAVSENLGSLRTREVVSLILVEAELLRGTSAQVRVDTGVVEATLEDW